MKVISTERLPIKLWLNDIEDGALSQTRNLANLPFAYKHIAIMPDSHQGYGMPIGGVLATDGYVIPNAVGVDIGCGMCAVKTSLTDISTDYLKEVMGEIRKAVPVGFNHHKEAQPSEFMPKIEDKMLFQLTNPVCNDQYNAARKQIGTLGGGNHFIEIQKGSDGHIWVMVHSGSRNFGLKIAEYYNKKAKEINNRCFSTVDAKQDLAFLPIDSDVGGNYLSEMQYAVDFALANRKLMMERILECLGSGEEIADMGKMINMSHNYARMENHFGKNVMIHRKGATSAKKGEIGIIPGSQGTHSYIVEGLGNPESFESCSHGAGRKMGRGQAQRTLNLEDEQELLNTQGIIHSVRTVKDLDEAPSAYKDIDVVMENQKDLVKVLVELTPLAVIKG
jgi:tRNA-splicing ligase RtcB